MGDQILEEKVNPEICYGILSRVSLNLNKYFVFLKWTKSYNSLQVSSIYRVSIILGSRIFLGSSFPALFLLRLGCDSLRLIDVDDGFPFERMSVGFHVRKGYFQFHMLELY